MRTTSSLESMNSQIQRMLPSNAHLYKFIESLKLHESIKSSDLYQLSKKNITNADLERKRVEDKARDEKIKKLSEKMKTGGLSAMDFLKAMSIDETKKKRMCNFNFRCENVICQSLFYFQPRNVPKIL